MPLLDLTLTEENTMTMKVMLLNEHAMAPVRKSVSAAGYDLFSSVDTSIPARGMGRVDTGISISIPLDCYARVAPRSGLTWGHSINVGAGVVDSDYRGEIKVILFNHSDVPFKVKKGDRIAQLILEKIYTIPVEVVDSLEQTERGDGGFGSTGK